MSADEAVRHGALDAVVDDPEAAAATMAIRLSRWSLDAAIETKALFAPDDVAARQRVARRLSDAVTRLEGLDGDDGRP
jgi:hypothetical protein